MLVIHKCFPDILWDSVRRLSPSPYHSAFIKTNICFQCVCVYVCVVCVCVCVPVFFFKGKRAKEVNQDFR